jgi:hypothetical protein
LGIEGDCGRDVQKQVLKVETVDVTVDTSDFFNASLIYTILARIVITFQEMLSYERLSTVADHGWR